MIELLQKCLKQPEPNPELFYFMEDALMGLDQADQKVQANFPLFFALHWPGFFGLRIDDNYSEKRNILDLQEGYFTEEKPSHPHYLENPLSGISSHLLKIRQPAELADLPLNKEKRRQLLDGLRRFLFNAYSGIHPTENPSGIANHTGSIEYKSMGVWSMSSK